jgi:Cd2+/Zn2+-exporting ATPase
MAFFGGIGAAASSGILYKGANTFSAIANAKNIVFDKTGTLTSGEFKISDVSPLGIGREELLYLVASAERGSNHPLARSLASAVASPAVPISTKELVGRGIISTLHEGEIAVGNRALMNEIGVELPENDKIGKLFVTKNGIYVGSITLVDEIKPEAKDAISRLKRLGVTDTYILSGDREHSCNYVGGELGISHIEHSLMPDDKYRRLEQIIESSNFKTIYVGDGINDAPCLARADIGVAMGGTGSDSAIEASDAVIMSDNLLRLADMIVIARRTLRISKQNIIFAIGVKLLVMLLVSLSLVGMWAAVFADVGVAVLAILNSMRVLLLSRRK